MRRERALAGLAVTALPLLVGCASSRPTFTVAAPVPTPTQTTTSTTQASISIAAPDPKKPPDFVLTGQTAVNECSLSDGRELIARLDLTTTIQSNLAGQVTIDGFHTLTNSKGLTEFLMGYSEGATCHPGNLPASEVELGSLQPHVPHLFTLWAILDKAITPNDPHPSAKELGQGWGMDIPTIDVNGTSATQGIAAGGPHVIACKPQSSEEAGGSMASGSFISITGTPAYTFTAHEASLEYRASCTKVPTP